MSFKLYGPLRHKATNIIVLISLSLWVGIKRLFGKKLVESWPWDIEVAAFFSRWHNACAMGMASLSDARQFADSLVFDAPVPAGIQIRGADPRGPRGNWFIPSNAVQNRTLLYCHGGGYAFYSKAHSGLISLVAHAAKAKTFALDYRLTPEYPHPAQIDDALACYQWLLAKDTDPREIAVAGDSAGGHLTLMLLRELRNRKLPMPALAIGLCPWTEVGTNNAALYMNDRFDWVQGATTRQFSEWLTKGYSVDPVTISPTAFDVSDFPPMYFQAGGKEVLYDMIKRFESHVKESGGSITLDVWEDMTHDFQAYGDYLPESREALLRIGEVVDQYLGQSPQQKLHSLRSPDGFDAGMG